MDELGLFGNFYLRRDKSRQIPPNPDSIAMRAEAYPIIPPPGGGRARPAGIDAVWAASVPGLSGAEWRGGVEGGAHQLLFLTLEKNGVGVYRVGQC